MYVKMFEDDVAQALMEYKDKINYKGLTLSDVNRIIQDPNFPTPEINRRIIDIALYIHRDQVLADDLDNSDFRIRLYMNTEGYNVIGISNYDIGKINPNSLESIIIRNVFNILTEDPEEIIETITERGLDIHQPIELIKPADRWKYGLLYAYLSAIDFVQYNVIEYEDAVYFGQAYFLYSYYNIIPYEKFVSYYDDAVFGVKYLILKLLKYNNLVNIDVLTTHSIITFFTEGNIDYSETLLENMRFYHKLPQELVEVIAKTNPEYTAVLMPRLLYELIIPRIANYLIRLPDETNKVIEELGIVPPEGYDPYKYIIVNSRQYNDMLDYIYEYEHRTEEDKIMSMTDREILDKFGFVPYISRDNLVNSMLFLNQNKGFFVPTKHKMCTNQTTVYGEDVNTELVVAYGTLHSYDCYSNDELLNQLEYENGIVVLKLWLSKTEITDKEILLNLRQLLAPFKEFKSFIDKLDTALRSITDINKQDLINFQLLTDEEKEQTKELLLQLFIIGMYMLRWTGNGPYPVNEKQTEINVDPEPKTIEALIQYSTMLSNSTINVQEYVSKLIVYNTPTFRGTKTVDQLIRIVTKGDEDVMSCIRINANKFINTGYVYLEKLFLYKIPGYNPQIH